MFVAPETVTDEVVHLHLEHRVVQRLLGRFSAQGFVLNDLSRACLAQSADPIPRVALIGRLCLYGTGAARLHEELIQVSARWLDPSLRKGKPLSLEKRSAEQDTIQLLQAALLNAKQPPSTKVVQDLQASAPSDVADLLPQLEKRGEQLANQAEKALAKRGSDEAKAMRLILEGQKKRIASTAANQEAAKQRLIDWTGEEHRQLEADKRHWVRRLGQIEQELEKEPERIEALYNVKARRIEPVGLVCLWPVSG